MRTEETDAPDFRRLLRERGKRRREEHAGECANERPSLHHWITSSARSSSDCGTARPSAFAVLRLITSSNLVGCSIGKSAGFAPLRILSTKAAVRPNIAASIGA